MVKIRLEKHLPSEVMNVWITVLLFPEVVAMEVMMSLVQELDTGMFQTIGIVVTSLFKTKMS